MAGHDKIRPKVPDLLKNGAIAQATALGIEQFHLVASVAQRPTHHEQAERYLVANAKIRRDRLVGGIDEEDFHGVLLLLLPGARGRSRITDWITQTARADFEEP